MVLRLRDDASGGCTAKARSPTRSRISWFTFLSKASFIRFFRFCSVSALRCKSRGRKNAATSKPRFSNGVCSGCWSSVLLHAYLLWAGDILSIYALMGFLLILFRRKTDGALLKWAFALMVIPILTYILFYILFVAFVPPEAIAMFDAAQMRYWNKAVRKVPQSSYLRNSHRL